MRFSHSVRIILATAISCFGQGAAYGIPLKALYKFVFCGTAVLAQLGPVITVPSPRYVVRNETSKGLLVHGNSSIVALSLFKTPLNELLAAARDAVSTVEIVTKNGRFIHLTDAYLKDSIGHMRDEPKHLFRISGIKPEVVDSLREQLTKIFGVELVEEDHLHSLELGADDSFLADQWAFLSMNVRSSWDYEDPSSSGKVVFAVLDTGINSQHRDLKDNILRDKSGKIIGYDFGDNDDDVSDRDGHGTHVAGAAMRTNNEFGGAGLSRSNHIKIMPLKVFPDNSPLASTSALIAGINYAADYARRNNVTIIINLSLGYTGEPSTALEDAIMDAKPWCWVVAAAGNDGQESLNHYPSGYKDVLSVAATTSGGDRASFSNWGRGVDLAAPGNNILSTYIDKDGQQNLFVYMSGTSMATPQVAMVLANTLAQKAQETGLTVQKIRQELLPAITHTLHTDKYIGGEIDAYRAMQASNATRYASKASSLLRGYSWLYPALASVATAAGIYASSYFAW